MDKKFEYRKEYPEAVYKDRVYKWFINSTRNMSDVELQKFVDLCMRGNLTFQCADEIDIDDPDISMIDHLLMDIASEKNDELINTYTDEIDWDNDYVEKYNRRINKMDKKLEARIARLEKLINEDNNRGADLYAEANKLFYQALAKYREARAEAINDGLDKKLLDRLTRMVEAFSDAGNKLVNSGNKWFDWTDWNTRHSN